VIASGGEDATIRLWESQTGKLLTSLEGHTSHIWSLTFSKMNRPGASHAPQPQPILISGSEDETIRLWDISTGECLKLLRGLRPYQGTNITAATGLTEAQKTSLKLMGAVDMER
jgi:WD40 repeat protein